jgi:hypothetical protein
MAGYDYRIEKKPIGKVEFPAFEWTTADHLPITKTIKDVNMLVERIDLIVSSGGDANPTITVDSIFDENGTALISSGLITTNFTNLADATKHILLSTRVVAEFDAIPLAGDVVLTIDASTAPDATLNVTAILYGP